MSESATAVRAARPTDLPALVALEAECFGHDRWPWGLVRAVRPSALVTGRPVNGYAAWHLAGDVADLDRLAVARSDRRTGLASALLHAVLDAATAAGATRLMLEVRADNKPAIALYTQNGLDQLDRRRAYYSDGTDALVLALDLPRSLGASTP